MIILFVLAGLAPVLVALGLLLWAAAFRERADALGLIPAAALGLILGALGGGAIGLLLIALVLILRHMRGG